MGIGGSSSGGSFGNIQGIGAGSSGGSSGGGSGSAPFYQSLTALSSVATTTGQDVRIAPTIGKKLRIYYIVYSVKTTTTATLSVNTAYLYHGITGDPVDASSTIILDPRITGVVSNVYDVLQVLDFRNLPLILDTNYEICLKNPAFSVGAVQSRMYLLYDEVV